MRHLPFPCPLTVFFCESCAPLRSQLIENPWPVTSASELMQHRMAIINLAANIDTRIQKMYEVRGRHCLDVML